MTTSSLSSVQALQPGAEIWVIPPPAESAWAARIDWYLNFQISRGLASKPSSRSSVIEKLLSNIKWTLPLDFKVDHASLLIAPMGRVPANWILIPEAWNNEEHLLRQLKDLKSAKIRIFPPAGVSVDRLIRSALADDMTVEIVSQTER